MGCARRLPWVGWRRLASWREVRSRMMAELGPEALETAREVAAGGRESGMVGPGRPVPEGADDQARLLAVFGRDPSGG